MTLSVGSLEKNWAMFEKLCKKACGEDISPLLDMLGERLIMCPLNTKLDQGGAYPGGMIEHALSVTMQMRKMNSSFDMNIDQVSILKVGLLHEIGRVGNLSDPLFLDQDSDWHRDKLGQMYKYNENIQKMSVSHRTLYLLQNFGVSLSQEEWIAIQTAQGFHFEENRFYVGSEPSLSLVLQQSKSFINHT
jgi:hypothetical protein